MNEVAMMTLVRPFLLGFTEPILIAWNCYLALIYGTFSRSIRNLLRPDPLIGILYCFISSFDIVFIGNHGFTLGQNGLAFLVSLHRCCRF